MCGQLPGFGVAHDVVAKAIGETVEKALGQLIVLGLGLDDRAQFSMEFVGPLAVGAPLEVADDLSHPVVG